jgi:putative phosphoesterase
MERRMKVGIIGDTHNNIEIIKKAIEIFKKVGVKYIFHSGDIISPAAAAEFAAATGAKFIAVFGNCDCDKEDLKETIEGFGGEIYEGFYSGMVNGKRIYMSHNPRKLQEVINSGRYDIVIYGHTHKQDIHWTGNVLIINPGSAKDDAEGKECLVILDVDGMACEVKSAG